MAHTQMTWPGDICKLLTSPNPTLRAILSDSKMRRGPLGYLESSRISFGAPLRGTFLNQQYLITPTIPPIREKNKFPPLIDSSQEPIVFIVPPHHKSLPETNQLLVPQRWVKKCGHCLSPKLFLFLRECRIIYFIVPTTTGIDLWLSRCGHVFRTQTRREANGRNKIQWPEEADHCGRWPPRGHSPAVGPPLPCHREVPCWVGAPFIV